ncbi:MAG: hypothetical protein LBP55_07945 [Candidatus Adiutrix sp.]|jgi:hypothetical protein|nr:hypothetical protein [Candidatus Adiutrix sp.]
MEKCSRKVMKLLGRTAGWALIAALGLFPAGCLVSDDEYDETLRRRDRLRSEVDSMHLANDQLNQEITQIYSSCDVLNTQIALTASLAIYNKYTTGLIRPKPVLPAPLPTTAAPTRPRGSSSGAAAPANTSRPPQEPGSATAPPRRQSQSGAGNTPPGPVRTPPPPPPPAPPVGPGGGSIDWGN